jgi:hypothetical protein
MRPARFVKHAAWDLGSQDMPALASWIAVHIA